MLVYNTRPIDQWPGKLTDSWKRKSVRFQTGYSDTLDLLERELQHMKAKDVVFYLAVEPRDIRNDGMPRSEARPVHPGIILAFETPMGPVRMPCDTFQTWQANLRAIALSLEALRMVKRYGVAQQGEQYRGWMPKLAAGMPAAAAMTLDEAAREIIRLSGLAGVAADVLGNSERFKEMKRRAYMNHHPDRTNGDTTNWKRVSAACELLDKHHHL